jgi:hypothetical protein
MTTWDRPTEQSSQSPNAPKMARMNEAVHHDNILDARLDKGSLQPDYLAASIPLRQLEQTLGSYS